jgi:hypothetical protein
MASPREQQAQHHVSEARRIVARQHRLIDRLRAVNGHSFRETELLATFAKSLALFEDDLAAVRATENDTGRTV